MIDGSVARSRSSGDEDELVASEEPTRRLKGEETRSAESVGVQHGVKAFPHDNRQFCRYTAARLRVLPTALDVIH